MFFIFGWNKPIFKSFGAVQQHQCSNCHNSEFWQLKKISRYFTLFFIPVFPHDNDYWYYCPVCNHGINIDLKTYHFYKSIAEINTSFLEHKIDESERQKQLNSIYETNYENN